MVHAVRIRKGKASYANHWVQTSRLKQELRAKRRLFTKARCRRSQVAFPYVSARRFQDGARRLGRLTAIIYS